LNRSTREMSVEWHVGFGLGLLGSIVGLSALGLLPDHDSAFDVLNRISVCFTFLRLSWSLANASHHHRSG
jgi:hypothetical protein